MKQQTITIKVTYDDSMDEAANWDWSNLAGTQVKVIDRSNITEGGNKYVVTSDRAGGLTHVTQWYAISVTDAIFQHLEKYPNDIIECVELVHKEAK